MWEINRKLLQRLANGDSELGIAGFGGVVEGIARAVSLRGLEKQSASDAGRETGEAGLAIDVGADFEVEFVEAPVSHANLDFGGVNRFAGGVCDGEVGGARTQSAVDDRNRMWVRLLGRQRECQG